MGPANDTLFVRWKEDETEAELNWTKTQFQGQTKIPSSCIVLCPNKYQKNKYTLYREILRISIFKYKRNLYEV